MLLQPPLETFFCNQQFNLTYLITTTVFRCLLAITGIIISLFSLSSSFLSFPLSFLALPSDPALQQLAHGGLDAHTGGVTKRYVAQLEFMEPRFPDLRISLNWSNTVSITGLSFSILFFFL